jgi:hypothetical protein
MPFYNQINNYLNFSISFSKTPRNDFGILAKGYRLAAETVVTELAKSNHLLSYKAYPVVFLYRHAFELNLKNTIYKLANLLHFQRTNDKDMKLYNHHDLRDLSGKARKVMLKAFPNDQSLVPILDDIVKTAKDFYTIDPDSYSFRYPIKIDGTLSTASNQIINPQSFSEHMSELLEKLEVIDFGIAIETHIAQEVYSAFDEIFQQ